MALTDEQYKQLFRYANGEMNTAEKKAFEAALPGNKELSDEVDFYKELRSLSESVEQKTTNPDLFLSGGKKHHNKKVWAIMNDARKNWEIQYEDHLKLKYGITAKEKTIPGEDQKNKIRRINISKWLTAAVLSGVAILGVFWWFAQDRNEDSIVSVNKKADSPVVNENKVADSPENIVHTQPMLPQENASPKNIAETKEIKQNKNRVAEQTSKKKYNIESVKRQTLFANHFKQDATPADADIRLRRALAFYNASDYDSALQAFEKSKTLI